MNKKKNSGQSTARLVTRIVIFGVLGVLLVLALLDNQKKNAAIDSYNAITAKYDERMKNNEELRWSEVEEMAQGSPNFLDADLGSAASRARSRKTIMWDGIFKDHSVDILLGLGGDDPFVQEMSASWEVPAEE